MRQTAGGGTKRGGTKRGGTEHGGTEHGGTEHGGGTADSRTERGGTAGRNLLCGAVIGAGAVLPGVSGGVLAVALGLYGPLMELLSRPRTALPLYGRMLPPLALGWTAGFFLTAKGAAAAFGVSETAAAWLFLGLIAGTLPGLYREAGRTGRDAAAWASLLLCAGGAFAGLFYATRVLRCAAEPNCFWYSVCGAIWGLSVVVPGLTSASLLMALGLYQPMLDALSRLDVRVLAACVPSMVLAAVLPARGVTWLLRRYRAAALHGVLGLAAGSALAAVPRTYSGAGEAAASAACCAAGFLLAWAVERGQGVKNI